MRAAVIDDDAGILDLIEQILREEGLATNRYQQVEELLPELEGHDFDLIISDLMLPGMTGLELLDELTARRKEIPVVIITGYASLDSAIEAVNRGAFSYIKKPFTIEEIRFIITRLRQRREHVKEMNALKDQVRMLTEKLVKEGQAGSQGAIAAAIPPFSLFQESTDVNKALSAIEYLGRLKSSGIISEKEFGEYKGRILKRIA